MTTPTSCSTQVSLFKKNSNQVYKRHNIKNRRRIIPGLQGVQYVAGPVATYDSTSQSLPHSLARHRWRRRWLKWRRVGTGGSRRHRLRRGLHQEKTIVWKSSARHRFHHKALCIRMWQPCITAHHTAAHVLPVARDMPLGRTLSKLITYKNGHTLTILFDAFGRAALPSAYHGSADFYAPRPV